MNCYFVSAKHPEFVLSIADHDETPEESQLVINEIDGTLYQQFMLFKDCLINAETGHILDLYKSKKGSVIVQRELPKTEDGKPIVQTKWSYHFDQTIRNESGLCLDVERAAFENGTPVIAWEPTGEDSQKWIPVTRVKFHKEKEEKKEKKEKKEEEPKKEEEVQEREIQVEEVQQEEPKPEKPKKHHHHHHRHHSDKSSSSSSSSSSSDSDKKE